MSGPPVLETERLLLREHRPEDLDAYHAMWCDPEVVRYVNSGGGALSREQAWDAILRHRGMWAIFGFGFWVIEDKGTGRLIGEVGMQERCRNIQPEIRGTLEAGWVLSPEWHGRGLAREAMGAVIDWCDERFPAKPFTCIINPANERSLKLAEKLGFRILARTSYRDTPNLLLQRG
ncbi:GNAT family N-acetyltransferase [Chelativorans salis]|uniref:GNAT family N-acetyltransferase n=1 Tax=Chelativorans salis TaxID=2978478 RepID=A0ABT2LRC0_9HYPH|nr:GNAT family N-acetyltransferase [Chelativorans sp. EGI FJ00035]MCT7376168.1 GNAT family N-acetyltransferase [Chelativorans sp. EGI FJ00035]